MNALKTNLGRGLGCACFCVVMGIVPIAIRSLASLGVLGMDSVRLKVNGSLGPGRKLVFL